MTAKAYLLGIGKGGPAIPPIWWEPFAQADYATLKAQYDANGAGSQTFTDDGFRLVSGGSLTMVSDGGAHSGEYVHLEPPFYTPGAVEYWWKIEMTVIGGVYDGTYCPMAFYALNSLLTKDYTEIDVEAALGVNNYGTEAYGPGLPQDLHYGSVSPALPVGAHTFILCASFNGTNMLYELWIDGATGSAPNISSTLAIANPGVDRFNVFVTAGNASGRNTSLQDILVIAGNRASNPFGIL